MNYSNIRQYDIANGEGVRTTLSVSGCTHKCRGCFNKEAQSFSNGYKWNEETEKHFINLGKTDNISGYSILGGEPFQQPPDILFRLLKNIKQTTGKTIWLWTGYIFESIPEQYVELLKYIDVLVDGEFVEELKDIRLKFRGSSNQRIINVKETINKHEIVLYKE